MLSHGRTALRHATAHRTPARRGCIIRAFAGETRVMPSQTATANGSFNFGDVKVPRVYPRFVGVFKGSPEKGELGDCPFSQRTMLTLEEKKIAYHKVLVDENNMPDWIGDVNPNGKLIPVVLDMETNQWLADSGKIVTYIEQHFPEPSFGTPDTCTDVWEGLMPAFMEFLKSKPGQEEDKAKQGLLDALGAIEDHLRNNANGGPFLAGDKPCSACFALAPQLNHMRVGTRAIKNWEMPDDFQKVKLFMQEFYKRDSWKNTVATDKYIQDGWNVKLEKMGAK